MLETVVRDGFKETVFKTLLTVAFASIYFHAFLLKTPSVAAMGTQSGLLVDPSVVKLIKLNVHWTFPIRTGLIIIACPIGIFGVEMNTGNDNTSFIVEQIQ